MTTCDRCGDNRFEIIEKAKQDLLESTNISSSEKEIEVLDSFLFRCWQMGWLDRYNEEYVCEANCATEDKDLDKLVISLEETIGTSPHSREVIKEHLQKATEYQKQQQERQMNIALQTEYEKGLFDMREKMLKDAVDATIFSELKGSDGSLFQAKSDRFRMNGVKISDRIKVIPIKIEQQ